MKFLRTLALVLAVLMVPLGAFLVRAGELDDSPGLGGIGIFVALFGLWYLYRRFRRRA